MSVSNVTGSPSLADLKDTTPVARDNQVQAQQDRTAELAAREAESRRVEEARDSRPESPRGNTVDTNA